MSIPAGEVATQEVQTHMVFDEGGHLAARRGRGRMEIQAMSQVGGVPSGASKPWQATNYLSYFLEGTQLDEAHMAMLVDGVEGARASHSGFTSYSYLFEGLDYHFPERDVGYPVEAVRTQMRGRCSRLQPWASTFQTLMDQFSVGSGCGV
ncbi:MAG: hypothetical protein IT374_14995 [Polyangiaceae bacterium]|nr:hypothetical protein [Polyangiaceae bacterium]